MTDTPKVRSSIPSEASTRHFDPVLKPDLPALYAARAARLRSLAEGHELEDYLRLAAEVADAQAARVSSVAPPEPAASRPDPFAIARDGRWLEHLDALIEALAGRLPAPAAPHLDALKVLPEAARKDEALALAEGRFDAVSAAAAPFLWAALSLEVALQAQAAPLPEITAESGESADCPVCGGAPVASLLHTGDRQGLRYLHCSMCECEWHVVRAKCTNCGDSGQVEYLSFDPAPAVVRAESCGHCSGYLKLVSQEKIPQAEVVADDLATLVLDDAAQAEGYQRTGLNPFALPQ